MQKVVITLAAMMFSLTATASSKAIESDSSKAMVRAARIVSLQTLVNKTDLLVNVLVKDEGGSTDVSPTQQLYLTIYQKGEMFSTDVAFDLGPIFSVISAKRISGGIYEIKLNSYNTDTSEPQIQTLKIDARAAVLAIKAVRCDDFDCDASENFASTIKVETTNSAN